MQFNFASTLPFQVGQVFDYHEQAGAINRLIPPWEPASVVSSNDSLAVGSIVKVWNKIGPIAQTWVAEHTQYRRNELFIDELRSGPFARWVHQHQFEPLSPESCRLTDSVDYRLHAAPLSNFLRPWVENKLKSMFRFRHRITNDDLRFSDQLKNLGVSTAGRKLRLGISGSSGLIGKRTVELARVLGIEVIRSVRNLSQDSVSRWPRGVESVHEDRIEHFEGLDAWIHLGGIGIADHRWTSSYMQAIRGTRIDSTNKLIERLKQLSQPPKAFICASGVGIYGNRDNEILNESSSVEHSATGDDFLSEVAREWEAAAMGFEDHLGGRTAIARFGMVLHPRAGALSKMLTPFKLGLGGPMGSGRQYWPWIHIDDAVSILLYLAFNRRCHGPFNVVAPECMSNRDFSKTLAKTLGRLSCLPAPSFALKLALGQMADSLLLASNRCVPTALLESGYQFRFPNLEQAFRNLLGS